ncbi:hypothetical protein [Streptomyces sp. NBC_00572]|uniref:hypothetical protein n=1 Tax=Streptomyces sp. NBC_00572 TaxID=2903664 RepID=UPI0022578AA9|nr:hypothetical protein [Streptomyces sp. NBC_00572]MCX4986009.1 hypothetical protein [Streptomyces sp. NBC_00572]
MLITIGVTDVIGRPLPNARIRLVFTSPSGPEPVTLNPRPGQQVDAPLALNQLEIYVSMDGFADELFLISAIGASGWLSSNPAGHAVLHDGALDISTTIGTVRLAPTVTVQPEAELSGNPRAALVDHAGGEEWIYRGAFHNAETMRRLDEPIFGDLTGMEWKRFNYSRVLVDLARHGRFVLLEFGPHELSGARLPRFLIGTWVPFKPLAATPEVVVFYSPPTFVNRGYPADSYPFLGEYPYGITKAKAAKDVTQPYVGLAVNYLVSGYKILYQLLAAGRNPIVVMPVQPSANWGPLDTQPGLGRLLKEVVRFLYANQLVSSRTAPLVKVRMPNGRTSLFPLVGRRGDDQVPRTFTATVSGFSAGINAVVNLCTGRRFDERLYPPALFHAPPETLMSSWHELWDIDGVDSAGWDHMVQTFRQWLPGSTRRTLRAYHSQTTYRRTDNGLVPQGRVTRLPRVPVKGVYAEEGHTADGRVTWVHFSDPALEGDVKAPGHEKTVPEFGTLDAHHFVPAIAFGHAAQFPLP